MNPITPTTPGSRNSISYNGQIQLSPASQQATSLKRSRDSDDGGESTPVSPNGKGKQPAVKRACNECRQQKLRCDVVQDPFESCSRCKKHKLVCLIEPNFKRIGKRSRHAEMEREIADLRARVTIMSGHPLTTPYVPTAQEEDPFSHSDAASSLIHLKEGADSKVYSLEDTVFVSLNQVEDLFQEYFDKYDTFLPFLDRTQVSQDLYTSPDTKLLFWVIISIAARKRDPSLHQKLISPLSNLIWRTMQRVPQDHNVVKALCLLCTWPLPAGSTSADQSFMLCGLMMQIAMQIGLHRPTNPKDFSRTPLNLQSRDIDDRMRTWAVCNIVAQSVSTGYGQPSMAFSDPTYGAKDDPTLRDSTLARTRIYARLRLARSANRISKELYSNHDGGSTQNAPLDGSRRGSEYANMENDRLREDIADLTQSQFTDVEDLFARATFVHLRLHAFFDRTTRSSHRTDLLDLYQATLRFLEQVFQLDNEDRLIYAPNLVFQVMIAAGFTLSRLLNSEFAHRISEENLENGRMYFTKTVTSLRSLSTMVNDLQSRLAEVLAQHWRDSGSGLLQNCPKPGSPPSTTHKVTDRMGDGGFIDDPLRLKNRARMSMSVVYDTLWRWREKYGAKRLKELDSKVINNPTNPESRSTATPPPGDILQSNAANLSALDASLNLASGLPGVPGSEAALNMPLALANGLAAPASVNSLDYFDSVSWMLDYPGQEWTTYTNYGDYVQQ